MKETIEKTAPHVPKTLMVMTRRWWVIPLLCVFIGFCLCTFIAYGIYSNNKAEINQSIIRSIDREQFVAKFNHDAFKPALSNVLNKNNAVSVKNGAVSASIWVIDEGSKTRKVLMHWNYEKVEMKEYENKEFSPFFNKENVYYSPPLWWAFLF